MNQETLNIVIGIIAVVVVIGVAYKLYKEEGFIFETKEHLTSNEGNMNKLVNNELSKYPYLGNEEIDEDMEIKTLNQSNDEYKSASYVDGKRGEYSKLESQDSYESQIAQNIDYSKESSNDKYIPNDNGDGNYASYNQEKKDFSIKELMNAEKLLPQEENDWFDTVPEPVKVQNRHLININRPIGVDTIGSSMKIACRDIRGNIPAPKFTVSPFLNSSVEPDIATVGFCNSNPYQ